MFTLKRGTHVNRVVVVDLSRASRVVHYYFLRRFIVNVGIVANFVYFINFLLTESAVVTEVLRSERRARCIHKRPRS